jgi:asparaginyl-tRNA synthetase
MKLICSDLKYLYERKVRDNRLVKVSGWIKSTRESAEYFFAEINDGSVFHNTNLFFEKKFFDLREIKKINICAGITVKGIFKNTPERKHSFEIVVKTIETVSPTNGDFPIQKKKSSLDFLREIPHLRLKTSYFLAVFRIKSYICSLIHDFFLKKNFIYLTTPVLTSIDGEGAGEMFSVDSEKGDFFARKANLTVSGQLQLEAFVQGLGKVYNFSPCFRAEKSKTTRHLSEF